MNEFESVHKPDSGFVPLVDRTKPAFEARTAQSESTGETPDVTDEQAQNASQETAPDPAEQAATAAAAHEQQLSTLRAELEAQLAEQQATWDAERTELTEELQQLKDREAQVERLLLDAEAAQVEHNRETRHRLGEVIVRTLKHLAGPALVAPEELLTDRLNEVSRALVTEQDVTVRVRPEDVEFAQAFLAEHENWKVVSDENVDMGALAETESEQLDATIAGALASVEEAVRAWIASSQTQSDEGSR